MAKRGTADEKSYDPFGESLNMLNAVMAHSTTARPLQPPDQPVKNPPAPVVVKEEVSQPEVEAPKAPPRPPSEPRSQKQLRLSPLAGEKVDPKRTELRKHLLRIPIPDSEKYELSRLTTNLSATLGTSVQLTHLVRGLLSLLAGAEDELIKRAKKSTDPRLTRPSNKDALALADFEDAVAELVDQAIRSSLSRRAAREG